MDDRERDKFYSKESAGANDDADGDEYELEPLDPEIASREQQRAERTIASSRAAVDIEEIYREAEHDRGQEILENWARGFQLRFQTKHLLIATAVLAVLLTLGKLDLLGPVLTIGIMLLVAGVYLYLQWHERKHQAELDARRQEMYARRREQLKAGPTATIPPALAPRPLEAAAPPMAVENERDEAADDQAGGPAFSFQFSMQQLMIAMTVAAIIFGLVHLLGGPSSAATLLGLIALGGLVIHAIGYEPPQIVVLGWWLMLVMYVVLSIVSYMWSAGN
jgi:hypothetical protein